MTKVNLETKVENLIAQERELLNNKEIFKSNVDKIFSDFKNESFIPSYEQLKSNINNKFNDYIVNAEAKLKIYDDSVTTTLTNLKNEIEAITNNIENSLKLNYEDLKTKINIEKEKIQGLMIINNNIFRECKFKNHDIKKEEMTLDEYAKPFALGFLSIGSISGTIYGIIGGIGFAECLGSGIIGGFACGGIGAIAGAIFGFIGFGAHNLYKNLYKKEEVIKVCKKAQNTFLTEFDNHYSKAKNTFDEDKKKIINDICNGVDDYIKKMKGVIYEINKN